jgi:hypothetical protein
VVRVSLSERLSAHERSLAALLLRQRELVEALGVELLRTRGTLERSPFEDEVGSLLAEQAESVARACRAAGEQTTRIEWMVATARDLRALASDPR